MVANQSSNFDSMLSNKSMKAHVTQLAANNENQKEFLTSLRVYAGQMGGMAFLTQGRSRMRIATRDDLMGSTVKQEIKTPAEEEAEESTKQASSSSGSKSHPIDIDKFGPLDVDDVESAVIGYYPIFLATWSTTQAEAHTDTATRLKLYQQLTLATPHHHHITRNCVEGDCYGYLTLILRGVTVTGQTRYLSLIALEKVKFTAGMSINQLASELRDVQAKANRIKKDAIDDDVLKGALLSLAQGHSQFERLATDFSKRTECVRSFNDIVGEFQVHETNLQGSSTKYRPSQSANMMTEPEMMYELAALLTRANAGSGSGGASPRANGRGPANSTRHPSSELCRNFQKGRCSRTASACKFSHDASSVIDSSGKTSERKQRTCYNCQKVGYHMANECTAPKAERNPLPARGKEQANHTVDSTPPSMDIAAFMQQLISQQKQRGDDQNHDHDDESVFMLMEEAINGFPVEESTQHLSPARKMGRTSHVTAQLRDPLLEPETHDFGPFSPSRDQDLSSRVKGVTDPRAAPQGRLAGAPRRGASQGRAMTDAHTIAAMRAAASAAPQPAALAKIPGAMFSSPTVHGTVIDTPLLYHSDSDNGLAGLPPLVSDSDSDSEDDDRYDDGTATETGCVLTEAAFSTGTSDKVSDSDTILLDSAASSHYLHAFDAPLSTSGRVQTDTKVKVNGAKKGSGMACLGRMSCELKTEGGTELSLDRVLLLPSSLRHRLASVGQLTKSGYTLMFHGDQAIVMKGGQLVVTVTRTSNNLYPIRITNLPTPTPASLPRGEQAMLLVDENGDSTEQCFLASSYYVGENFAQRMHVKFNHSSVSKGTPLYHKLAKEYGPRFTDCPSFACSACLFTKVHRLPHPRRSKEDRDKRDGGGAIGKLFLDSFAWPYPSDKGEKVGTVIGDRRCLLPITTRTKAETPGRVVIRLKQLNKSVGVSSIDVSDSVFKVLFGNGEPIDDADADEEAGPEPSLKHIRYLKTDGAAEFMGSELSEFCEQHGIEKKASCGHTPQQNPGEPAVKLITQGIAVLHRQLPLKSKWTYAFRYFCRVHNLLPNTGLPGDYDTPYEAVQQRHVDFKKLTLHVHPYGCLVFICIPKALLSHTHGVDKGLPCANLGFSDKKEGFVVLTLGSRTVIDGVWDAFFIEDRFPIAELHADAQLRGLPVISLPVTLRWAGVDLSWKGLVTGDYANEPVMSTTIEIDDDTTTAPPLKTDDSPGTESVAVGQAAVSRFTDDNGLANWHEMPRLEPAPSPELPISEVDDSTLLQIKSALSHSRRSVAPTTATSEPSAPRRSGRIRQPSNELLTALANLPPSAPSPTLHGVAESESPLVAPISPDDELALLLDECAMLASVQREAAAAYDPDHSTMPAPISYGNAMKRSDSKGWHLAMAEHLMKLRRIGKKGVYRIVPRVEALNVMRSQWVFARKARSHHDNGQTLEDSARVVAGGYSQEYEVDYKETYAPTMPLEAYKINEADVIDKPFVIREEWDLSGAYYQATPNPKYTQWMEQPQGFGETPESYAAIDLTSKTVPEFPPITGARTKFVWLLLRCMPGTKDAGHHFNDQMSAHMTSKLSLTANPGDSASFFGKFDADWIRLNTYVDDMPVFCSSQALIDKCYELTNARFPCKRHKGINLIIGITVVKTPGRIEFTQKRLIDDLAEFTGQLEAGNVRTPYPSGWSGFSEDDCVTDPAARAILDKWPFLQALGKAAYVVRCTRHEGLWLVSILQRHCKNYGPAMIKALLRLCAYLYSTRSRPLVFKAGYPDDLHPLVTMVDASFASSKIDGTSHEGALMWHNGCLIHASSKRQRLVALSSTESEFMGATNVARTLVWVRSTAVGFGMRVPLPMPILEDNTAAIYLSRKPNLNGPRTRHMDVRWHWLQQQVLDEVVILHHLRTHFQVADILTKGVDHGTFKRLSDVLLGDVPVWEYGGGALRRALHPSNALTREALMASNLRARAAQQRAQRATTTAQAEAALMFGSSYRGDVTGDGAFSQPSSQAQELAAMMYGSRYSGDVMGDGAGSNNRAQDDSGIVWWDLRPIASLLYPGEPPYTNVISLRRLQLTANVMGGGEHAAEALIRHLGQYGEAQDLDDPADVARGVGELTSLVNAASAMIYIAASRIAYRLYDVHDEPISPASPAQFVQAINGVVASNAIGAPPADNINLLAFPPAEPFMPPQYEDAKEPEQQPPMSRAALMMGGMRRAPGTQHWTLQTTQAVLDELTSSPSTSDSRVGITPDGQCYHHVTCHVLFKHVHSLRAPGADGIGFHGSVVIQLSSKVRAYNASHADGGALRPCGYCKSRFNNPIRT